MPRVAARETFCVGRAACCRAGMRNFQPPKASRSTPANLSTNNAASNNGALSPILRPLNQLLPIQPLLVNRPVTGSATSLGGTREIRHLTPDTPSDHQARAIAAATLKVTEQTTQLMRTDQTSSPQVFKIIEYFESQLSLMEGFSCLKFWGQ